MIYLMGTELMENVFHFKRATPYDEPTMDNIASMMTSWENDYASIARSNGVALTQIRVTALDSQSAPQVVHSLLNPIAGDIASPPMPGSVTLAVKLETTRGPRGSQGRHFWIGLAESQVEGNYVQEAQALSIRAQLAQLILMLVPYPERGLWSILHSKQNGAFLNPRIATPVNEIVLSNYNVDRQGSRLPGKHRKKRTQQAP
jgi:hypothetical protein